MTAELAQQLDALNDWVARLEREVADGAEVDLTGLDGEVQRACDAVAQQPQETVAELRPRLSELLAGMDRLEARMREQFDGIRAELQAHGRRSQANRAYAQWMPGKPATDT